MKDIFELKEVGVRCFTPEQIAMCESILEKKLKGFSLAVKHGSYWATMDVRQGYFFVRYGFQSPTNYTDSNYGCQQYSRLEDAVRDIEITLQQELAEAVWVSADEGSPGYREGFDVEDRCYLIPLTVEGLKRMDARARLEFMELKRLDLSQPWKREIIGASKKDVADLMDVSELVGG